MLVLPFENFVVLDLTLAFDLSLSYDFHFVFYLTLAIFLMFTLDIR